MAQFLGNYEGFRYTSESALATNTPVIVGGLIGITRDACPAGGTVIAFMTNKKSVYSIPLAATAEATVNRGTAIKINTDGEVATATAGDAIAGYLWEAIAVGDTEAKVVLNDFATATTAAASTTAAGLMSAADKTKLDGIGIATATKAGLVQPDGTSITVTEAGVIATAGA